VHGRVERATVDLASNLLQKKKKRKERKIRGSSVWFREGRFKRGFFLWGGRASREFFWQLTGLPFTCSYMGLYG
jgi:hypothetical protein